MNKKFPKILNEQEVSPTFDLLKIIDIQFVVIKIVESLGIELAAKTKEAFLKDPKYVFLETDIGSFIPRVKYTFQGNFFIYVSRFATAKTLCNDNFKGSIQSPSFRLLQDAKSMGYTCIKKVNVCPINNFLMGTLHLEHLNSIGVEKDSLEVQENFSTAINYFEQSIKIDPNFPACWGNYVHLLVLYSEYLAKNGKKSESKKIVEKAEQTYQLQGYKAYQQPMVELYGKYFAKSLDKLEYLAQKKEKKRFTFHS